MADIDNVPQGDMTPAVESKNFYLAPEPPKKKRKAPLIIGIIAAVALIAVLGVVFWWQTKRDSDTPLDTTVTEPERGTEETTEEVTTEEVTTPHVHTEKVVAEVAPTCTETGLTEGRKCSACAEILVEQTVMDALGHNYVSSFIFTSGTEDFQIEYVCAVCNNTYITETIDALSFTITSENRSQIGYTGEDGENLVFPAVFQNGDTWYRVTSIGDSAFESCTGLTSIVIPEGVTSIGARAFYECTDLTAIRIPDSVTSFGERAFQHCTDLTSVVLPIGMTGTGNYTFSDCTGLTSVVIPEGITSIDAMAFYNCINLTSITIPASVTSIRSAAFACCSSLTSITVEKGNSVYHSDGNCLIQTASKTLVAGCKNSIIPVDGSVTSIGESAFEGSTGLTSIAIPNSVTSIDGYSFYKCTGLTSIEIPACVTSIYGYAFNSCKNLKSITYKGTTAQWNAVIKGSSWNSSVSATEVICSDGTVPLK